MRLRAGLFAIVALCATSAGAALCATSAGAALCATSAGAAPPGIDAMRWHRRVLLVASPTADDPRIAAQRRILAGWRAGARARDLSLVEIAGGRVTGVGATAASLARRFDLPVGRFQVILVGKDGRVALRSGQPLRARMLQGAIDAMPMRRASGRCGSGDGRRHEGVSFSARCRPFR